MNKRPHALSPEEQYEFTTAVQRYFDELYTEGVITTEEVSRLSNPGRMIELCRENVELTQQLHTLTQNTRAHPSSHGCPWSHFWGGMCSAALSWLIFALFFIPFYESEINELENRLDRTSQSLEDTQQTRDTLEEQVAERDLRIEAYTEVVETLKEELAETTEKLFKTEVKATCLSMPPTQRTGSWAGYCD